jgi:hypothetical protein
VTSMEEVKSTLMIDAAGRTGNNSGGPPGGFTMAVPRFEEDLEALTLLTKGECPTKQCVRNRKSLTAYYGFGDASSAGLGATVECPEGLQGRFGLWGRDEEGQSSNYQELRNLVKTVEEIARAGYLTDGELWIFTDNSTAESCFFKGGSSLKLFHDLILRLRQVEMSVGFVLHMVHVAWTRMIEQGTNGLSRGTFLEGVVAGGDMLSFIDLAGTACERHPPVQDFVSSWLEPIVGKASWLRPEDWFVKGHEIVGSERDIHGVWIPTHAKNSRAYVWEPPPNNSQRSPGGVPQIHSQTN